MQLVNAVMLSRKVTSSTVSAKLESKMRIF